MLNVQTYLRGGKTFDDLTKELGINVARHDLLPLAILNYDQIESPKTHPVVRECRGLVLNSEDFSLVSRAFPRFYNWGEVADEMPLFNWNAVKVTEKVDGSLVLIYNFEGEWFANTRGSFGHFPILNTEWEAKYHNIPQSFTWRNAFCKALGINGLDELNGQLDPSITYVCEFVSPWNKVVRDYKEPAMYLLTRYAGEEEIGPIAHPLFRAVQVYHLRNVDDITAFLQDHPEATFEGVVVVDDQNRRWKLKNARYVSLHKMKGNNGEQLYNPSNLIPYILEGEGDELLNYFPEIKDVYGEYKEKVEKAYVDMEVLWKSNWQIENQKDFALSIVGKTPFTGVLFNLRKELGKNQSMEALKKTWRNSADVILKVLFKK